MALVCAGCKQSLKDSLFLPCSNCDCHYDLKCANVLEHHFIHSMTATQKSTWICHECRSRRPKAINSATPASPMMYSRSDVSDSANVTLRRKAVLCSTQSNPCCPGANDSTLNECSLETVLMELRAFREEGMTRYHTQEASINKMAEDIKEIRCSVVNLHGKYNVLRMDVDKLLETSDVACSAQATLQLQCDDNTKRIVDLEMNDFGCEIMIQRQRIDVMEKQIMSSGNAPHTHTNLLNMNNSNNDAQSLHEPAPINSSVLVPNSAGPPSSVYSTVVSQQRVSSNQPIASTYNTRIFTTGKTHSRPRRSIIRATGAADTDLKTVEPIRYIHAWNFHPDVSVESLRS